MKNNVTLTKTNEGIEYSDTKRNETLLFITLNRDIESPVTKVKMYNKNDYTFSELIKRHIRIQHRKKRHLVEPKHWRLYAEAKHYYTDSELTYEEFLKHTMTEYLNEGYSSTLLMTQDLVCN